MTAFLFSPREVREAKETDRTLGRRYNRDAYLTAIARGCEDAIDMPNQLRHTFGTLVRREASSDTALVLLGHTKLKTTEGYAEPSLIHAVVMISEAGSAAGRCRMSQ